MFPACWLNGLGRETNISLEFYNIKSLLSGRVLEILNLKHPDRCLLQELIGALRKPPNTGKTCSETRCNSALTRLSRRIFPASN